MTSMKMVEVRYKPRELDAKWQERWEQDGLHVVRDDDPRPKWYALTMYPYPSGDLHIGHWYAMAPADAHARFKRMQGYNVLHPMGFDAFGLPAENAAIKRGIHPLTWTMGNIENMRHQLRSMGTVYDWTRETICCLPEYYRWNQWFFLKFYRAGLAYRTKAPANWCTSCLTVLANEQVVDGRCERCDTFVTRRDLEQWFLSTTRYADDLLDFSGLLDWPDRIKTMQANWIGRSTGVEVSFGLRQNGLAEKEIRTFTTRIDTIFGVTFLVLAPEHPLVLQLTSPDRKVEVEAYIQNARSQSDIERLSTDRNKTGVFIGAYCANPLNGDLIPIYIADYALLSYGTGVVMGVPAHDSRDFTFARAYNLPVKVVIAPPGWSGAPLEEAWTEEQGTMTSSGHFDEMSQTKAKEAIADFIEEQGWGKRSVSYRIRDWLISRQRYWGTPIPIIYCPRCGTLPVPEEDLPVLLPNDVTEFRPKGESPLRHHEGFYRTTCPQCGGKAHRETDTMDTFVDSSWYFLRYLSPNYDQGPFNPEMIRQWMPVDQYTGGAEHAVMHLLYARFFIKALKGMGIVEFDEPFRRLFNQGTIVAQRQKMSKSRGNVITPDPYVQELGADVVRAYLMFLGPWGQGGEWSDSGINGVARWMNRVWDLVHRTPMDLDATPTDQQAIRELQRLKHRTIKRAVNDLEKFKFNTMLAALMEFTNEMQDIWENKQVDAANWHDAIRSFLLILAPVAPHVAEELWEHTEGSYSIHNQLLPDWDEELAKAEEFELVVQINGKLKDKILVSADVPEETAKRLALESDRVKTFLHDKCVTRIIYVPGRLVNVVVS